MWMTLEWQERIRFWLPRGESFMKDVDLDEPTSFLDRVFLGCTQRECKPNEHIVKKRCFNHVFSLEQLKNYQGERNLTQKQWLDLTTWKDMLENALKGVRSFQVLAWVIIRSRRRNLNQLENCQKYTHRLDSNACTWHELVDLTFYGQWTILPDQSQNGPRAVKNAWIDWFHTFITQVITTSIVMWVIRQNNADWDCFKTQTLLATLRT